ncbi:hypothetical protein SCP_1700760 [Sparassis crispa]|uniref:Uncharacterized protein n=1 Tax=Sparassis crispa TaxID=139825 RepID=A0A401H5U0_9APHY|nr:hypothetical protein SCP_1700760 [Sparassis crispa]GBE89751.1 hypothetical protein SCP_1700760 [Sparassis crispa]
MQRWPELPEGLQLDARKVLAYEADEYNLLQENVIRFYMTMFNMAPVRTDPHVKTIVDGFLPRRDVLVSSLIMCAVQPDERHAVMASCGVNNADNLGMLFKICRATPKCARHLKRLRAQMTTANMAQCHEDVAALRPRPILGGAAYLRSDSPESEVTMPPTSPMVDTSLPPSSPITSLALRHCGRPPLDSGNVSVLVVCKGSDIPLVIPARGILRHDYLEFTFKQSFIETMLVDDHTDKQYLLPGDIPIYHEKGSTWRPTEAQISNIQAAVSTRLPALLATMDTFAKSNPNTPSSSSSGSRYIPSTPSTSGNSKAGSSLSSSTRVGKCALSPNMEMEGRRSKQMDNGKVCEVTDYDIELTDDEVEAEIVPNDDISGEVIEIVEGKEIHYIM